jgi:hypothetical protein
MRLLESAKRTVTVKPPKVSTNAYNSDDRKYRFDDEGAIEIRAVIQPMSGHVAAQIYGTEITNKRRMLYDGQETVSLGMGVCVDVDADSPCDYRIEDLPSVYGNGIHSAVLTYIPPERRWAP